MRGRCRSSAFRGASTAREDEISSRIAGVVTQRYDPPGRPEIKTGGSAVLGMNNFLARY
jgi:hypothetical protein